ncbi:hypothetical protein RSal33209_2005 [Renibacterium salmoninarum ATCC 33209]|uniref:Uncharacterized protein n=1 Tax=Renibacterium salmoninarum (strain ATCC 33209 / DSM 20767 / JCM 11484 / NBRC 15589 / NCIMB 2235) TaxID=288705 RepID=A9WSF0_RENSM|nr:hypothetical protein RSal33209_2005 [Renibacterium salmoninarum ATCC 33209]
MNHYLVVHGLISCSLFVFRNFDDLRIGIATD